MPLRVSAAHNHRDTTAPAASAIIHSAVFPEYQVRGVEETIRLICVWSPALWDLLIESFDRFPTRRPGPNLPEERRAALRKLISAAGMDVKEKARREKLLHHLESADQAHPRELAKYSLEQAGVSAAETDHKQ